MLVYRRGYADDAGRSTLPLVCARYDAHSADGFVEQFITARSLPSVNVNSAIESLLGGVVDGRNGSP